MKTGVITLLLLLTACTSTPYKPAVVVKGSEPFTGLAQLLADTPDKELDVILVHGMCTHHEDWARETIGAMANAANHGNVPVERSAPAHEQGIDIVSATVQLPAGRINFSAFIWSNLTAPGKALLAYDTTGTPTDCATNSECKPVRATLNGKFKDTLLNDCLADALIYQGERKKLINQAFIGAISKVATAQTKRNAGKSVPLVLITESLGSKMTFDAVNLMTKAPEKTAAPEERAAKLVGDTLVERVSYLFMGANQLPILSLADHAVPAEWAAEEGRNLRNDALSQFLGQHKKRWGAKRIHVIAFTDPNDQLSYRLLPEHYSNKAAIANVLVSNDKTYFGYGENPYTAHTGYLANDDVTQAIVCGIPTNALCKK